MPFWTRPSKSATEKRSRSVSDAVDFDGVMLSVNDLRRAQGKLPPSSRRRPLSVKDARRNVIRAACKFIDDFRTVTPDPTPVQPGDVVGGDVSKAVNVMRANRTPETERALIREACKLADEVQRRFGPKPHLN